MSHVSCLVSFCIFSGCVATKPNAASINLEGTHSVLSTLKMRYDLVDSITMWMNVRVESRGQKEELRASLYYEKPDKLRVDARGPFNEPKAIVLAVEKAFKIYFVAENELIAGDLSDGVINDVFDVDIRVSDVYSSIFANPFLDGNVGELKMEDYGDKYLILRPSVQKGYREEIYITAKNGVSDDVFVDKWRILDIKGKLIQEIAFSKYQEIGGIQRPLKAVIRRLAEETTISIESISPEINVKFPEATFYLPIPEGVKTYQLSELKKSHPQSPDQ